VTVALAHANCVTEEDMQGAVASLGHGERRRLADFVRPQRRRQFVLGRILLRSMLAAEFGVHPKDIDVHERPGNSPLIRLDQALPAPYFSLSHSADWIACVISRDTAVGIDVEVINPARDIAALSHAAFTADECAWLEQQPHDRQTSAFHHLWSLKEALYKMQGSASPPLIDSQGMLASDGEDWQGLTLAHPDVSLVICSALSLAHVHVFEHAEDHESACQVTGEGIKRYLRTENFVTIRIPGLPN
jgi:4'-phosphopantetheinyl transferase